MNEFLSGLLKVLFGALLPIGFTYLRERRRIRIDVEAAGVHFKPTINDGFNCQVRFKIILLIHNTTPAKKAIWNMAICSGNEKFPVMDKKTEHVSAGSMEAKMGMQVKSRLEPLGEIYIDPKSFQRLQWDWEVTALANDMAMQKEPFFLEHKTEGNRTMKKRLKVRFSRAVITHHGRRKGNL